MPRSPLLRVALSVAVLAVGILGYYVVDRYHLAGSSYFIRCGGAGEACCRPPGALANPAFGHLVACNNGLGCDVQSRTCVQPCGAAGQVCCDGPETRAVKWTADGKVYSPNTFEMKEMCIGGACDVAAHRCFSCGTTDGGACCPPDAAQATARCFGHNMSCAFDTDSAKSGTCRQCGTLRKPPCEHGCDPPLKVRQRLCDLCGAEGQPPCDTGCNWGLGTVQGLCKRCGAAGQIPCDHGCHAGTKLVNGICRPCGGNGQPPCDQGCKYGFTPINGVCRPCGANGQPPCERRCDYPMKIANGVCRLCGAKGQIPCDIGCDHALIVVNGICASPPAPQPQTCAGLNEPCVPPTQPGVHCCQQPGAPLKCIWGVKCVVCVPHGEVCQLGGSQTCCAYDDVCVLDPGTGNAVCDLPDIPDK